MLSEARVAPGALGEARVNRASWAKSGVGSCLVAQCREDWYAMPASTNRLAQTSGFATTQQKLI